MEDKLTPNEFMKQEEYFFTQPMLDALRRWNEMNKSDTPIDDEIDHPSHYTQGKIEVIDFLIDQDMNFMAANTVKYICRYRFKDNPVQDLKKARWYLDRLIKEVEIAQPDPRCKTFGVAAADLPFTEGSTVKFRRYPCSCTESQECGACMEAPELDGRN